MIMKKKQASCDIARFDRIDVDDQSDGRSPAVGERLVQNEMIVDCNYLVSLKVR
jgi:hypothetical protein